MIRRERVLEFPYIVDDPVRPGLSMEYRTDHHRQVYSYVYDDAVAAVVCVAFTKDVPITMQELDTLAVPPEQATCAIFYTIWSYKKGFGRSLIMEGIPKFASQYPSLRRFVTLSPKTEMAFRFHTKNGAEHIANNPESDNYEYNISKCDSVKVVV
jgi:hypothetical protein